MFLVSCRWERRPQRFHGLAWEPGSPSRSGHGLVQAGVGVGVDGPAPVKPKVVLAPGAIVPFQEALRTVTVLPLVLRVPFQSWVMLCPPGVVQVTVQALIGAVVGLVMVTVLWKPSCQLLTTWYAAVHATEPVGGVVGEVVGGVVAVVVGGVLLPVMR